MCPEKYPSLFQAPEAQKKHRLFHQDESKANCLWLALEDGQFDICQMIIDKVDIFTLKSATISGNRNALKVIEDKIKEGADEFEEMKEALENKIGKKKQKVK